MIKNLLQPRALVVMVREGVSALALAEVSLTI